MRNESVLAYVLKILDSHKENTDLSNKIVAELQTLLNCTPEAIPSKVEE